MEDHAPGDLVVVRNSQIKSDLGRKSKPRWLGPFVVVCQTISSSYILAELNGVVSKLQFAAFWVKKFDTRKGLTFHVEDFLTKEELEQIAKELREEEESRCTWEQKGEDNDQQELTFAGIERKNGGAENWGGIRHPIALSDQRSQSNKLT